MSGDAAGLRRGPAGRGLGVAAREDALEVTGPAEDAMLDGVRDAAADTGVGLREVRSAGPTLEDALVDAIE